MPLTSHAGNAEPSLFDSSIVFTIVRSMGGGMIFFLLRTGGTITWDASTVVCPLTCMLPGLLDGVSLPLASGVTSEESFS